MSSEYGEGKITVDGVELDYHFERAVVLGQPGEPKVPYGNEGGLVLRGDLKGVIAAFEILKEKS